MDFVILNSLEGRIEYLNSLKSKILSEENWQPIKLTRDWVRTITKGSGVYVIRHGIDLVYVGETGSLCGRMADLLDSRNHTIRRSLGKKYFANHAEYCKASSTVRYSLSIESLIDNFIIENLSIAFLEVNLGRKELEDFIACEIKADARLNIRMARKSK